jgi:hypothetical protein
VLTKRADEWTVYLAELRAKHGRKTRFLEVLDGLGGKMIVDG